MATGQFKRRRYSEPPSSCVRHELHFLLGTHVSARTPRAVQPGEMALSAATRIQCVRLQFAGLPGLRNLLCLIWENRSEIPTQPYDAKAEAETLQAGRLETCSPDLGAQGLDTLMHVRSTHSCLRCNIRRDRVRQRASFGTNSKILNAAMSTRIHAQT